MRWGEWVRAKELSWAEAGRRLGVTTSAARQFDGRRIPRPPTMRRMCQITAGEVTANDFYGLTELLAEIAAHNAASPPALRSEAA